MKDYFLKTERLGFFTWNEEDLDIAISLWGDPDVTKLINSSGQLSNEQVKLRLFKEIENFNNHGIQYWPMYLLITNELVGCCGLRPYNIGEGIYELGFHLRKDFWRKGYAYEAAQAIIDYSFGQLKIKSLFAGHNPNNIASKKLLLKLGFKYTHDEYYEGTGLNHPSYELIK